MDDYIYIAMNMHSEALPFEIPRLPAGKRWHVFANTSRVPPDDVSDPGAEPPLGDEAEFVVGGRSVAILVGRDRRTTPT